MPQFLTEHRQRPIPTFLTQMLCLRVEAVGVCLAHGVTAVQQRIPPQPHRCRNNYVIVECFAGQASSLLRTEQEILACQMHIIRVLGDHRRHFVAYLQIPALAGFLLDDIYRILGATIRTNELPRLELHQIPAAQSNVAPKPEQNQIPVREPSTLSVLQSVFHSSYFSHCFERDFSMLG